MKHITIAMAQMLVEGGEPERNFARAAKLIEEAAKKQCDIVLLPETIDFAWTHPSSLSDAKPIPGEYSQIFADMAKKHAMYICVGLTEKRANGNCNSAILFDRNGKMRIKYSKINLLTVEHPYYMVGSSLHVAETEFGRIGVNICADNYPESVCIAHTLCRMGAQIILSPSSWTVDYAITEADDPYRDKWIAPLTHIAKLYNVLMVSTTGVGYIVGGPYEGKKMVGCSLAVGKDGIVAQGQFNEFAGELIVFESPVPQNQEKGTEIGDRLKSLGCIGALNI